MCTSLAFLCYAKRNSVLRTAYGCITINRTIATLAYILLLICKICKISKNTQIIEYRHAIISEIILTPCRNRCLNLFYVYYKNNLILYDNHYEITWLENKYQSLGNLRND